MILDGIWWVYFVEMQLLYQLMLNSMKYITCNPFNINYLDNIRQYMGVFLRTMQQFKAWRLPVYSIIVIQPCCKICQIYEKTNGQTEYSCQISSVGTRLTDSLVDLWMQMNVSILSYYFINDSCKGNNHYNWFKYSVSVSVKNTVGN